MGNRKYNRETLIEKMLWYNENIGFPISRNFTNKNNMPSAEIYRKEFGSFQNAILKCGIKIPKNRECFFNRETLSDEELLYIFKKHSDEKIEYLLENNIRPKGNYYTLTFDEFVKYKMPSESSYIIRFDSIENIYKKLGIDYKDYNLKYKKEDMIRKFLEIYNILGRIPTNTELDEFSKKSNRYYYGCKTYNEIFGSLYNLHVLTGEKITWKKARDITEEEMLLELKNYCDKYQIYPTQKDIYSSDEITCGYGLYNKKFGNLENAIKLCGTDLSKLRHSYNRLSSNGISCLSYFELMFCNMLEKYKINFKKEEKYSDFIESYNGRSRFDFTIYIKEKPHFVEIFGYIKTDLYLEITKNKINLCKENNLSLFEYYAEDFKFKLLDDLFCDLVDRFENININLKQEIIKNSNENSFRDFLKKAR